MKTFKMNWNLVRQGFLLLMIFPALHSYAANEFKAEKEAYIKIFEAGDPIQARDAIKKLEWSGITDFDVYDPIEKLLLDTYKARDKASVEASSWYAKALGYSGQAKYKKTLLDVESFSPPSKLKKYLAKALENIDNYQVWNPIINKGLNKLGDYSLEQKRIINLLNASEGELVRFGAKRIYWEHKQDPVLLDHANKILESNYKQIAEADSTTIDAYAWLCKALAQSGQSKYKPTLEQVANNSSNKKLSKYAKKYVKSL